jgi:hypothetical protein
MNNQIATIVPVMRTIREKNVILNADLAPIYGMPTKALNQAVKRNLKRFPNDFFLQLTLEEIHLRLPSVFHPCSICR